MRTVRREYSVEDAIDAAREEWPRLEDALEMIEWVLARDPTKGDPIREAGAARTFMFEGSVSHGMPNIAVIYVDEAPYVTIKSVRFSRPTYSAGYA